MWGAGDLCFGHWWCSGELRARFFRRHRNDTASGLVGARPGLMGKDKQKASSRRKQLSRGVMRAWGWGLSWWTCQVEESSILSRGHERRVGEYIHSQSCLGSCREPGNYEHGRLGKGKVERRALGERLSKTTGLMELGKDVKPGSNMTVDFWQREEKRNYSTLYT